MSRGFAVSVRTGGVSPQAEGSNCVVVTSRFPESTINDKGPAGDVHVTFSGERIFRASQGPSEAQQSIESAGCTQSNQTLVVFGDSGSCSVGSGDVWEALFSSLCQIEGTKETRASYEGKEVWQEWGDQQEQHLTGGSSAAAGATSHGIAAGLVNEAADANTSDLLKVLGPRRAAYARRVCAVLSSRCRWRSPFARPGSSVARPPCTCMPTTAVTSPSAAFCLAFHSKTLGLLFFCRDKLGLASLLAVCPSNSCPDECRPCFVLATSATHLRSLDPPKGREGGGKERTIEVPVDGVWVLDLWALAAPEALPGVAVRSAECSEPEGSTASLSGLPNLYCIPWEQRSIIRTTHMWCLCTTCAKVREQFWKWSNCQCRFQLDTLACPLPQETGHCLGKPLGNILGFADVPPATPALESIRVFGVQNQGGSSCLSSTHVLKNLYRELFGAVARAIPEALQKITGTSRRSVSGADSSTVFVGLLFSGGVDSTLLAGMVLRVLAAAMAKTHSKATKESSLNTALPEQLVVVELVSVAFSAEAPDRLTALRSFQDLLALLHALGKRYEPQACRGGAGDTPSSKSVAFIGDWALELRLVAVDVANADSADCRSQLLEVIYPKQTHMDFNIAAPLYFSARGIGYLVSPNFDKSGEWQLLLKDASLWNELLIRPLFRRSRGNCHPVKPTHLTCTGETAAPGHAVEPVKAPAVSVSGQQQEAKVVCRVCRRQAKSGCAHCTCKLCCAKLQAAAVQRAFSSVPDTQACDEIHVGGQGRLRISDLGFAVHAACPVHRKPRLLCSKEEAGNEGRTDAYAEGLSSRGDDVAPFKSLFLLPCGVPLATNEAGRPFMAMHLADLHEWCTLDGRRWRCIDSVTGNYTVQSTVFLMGSGADEIFGGYGRHRTANLTKGWEALRHEQILDLRRLWFRNMGRDCRALFAFGRWARVPFLDERLLDFVCCSVPFEHIVQPSADVRAAAEEVMRRLLMKAITPTQTVKEEDFNCPSASSKRTDLLERVEELTMNAAGLRAPGGQTNNTHVEPEAGSSGLCSANKWLIRICAAFCGLSFSAVAKKRAMQFGSRSAKVSNSECFPSNRKARGDATLEGCDENTYL